MKPRRWLVLCDGTEEPRDSAAVEHDRTLTLAREGRGANLTLHIQTPSRALFSEVSGRSADLIRIAAFVYGADQSVRRSGEVDLYGDQWRRELTLCIPVSEPDFWNQPAVATALVRVLRFASGDRWSFRFSAFHTHDQNVPLDMFELNPRSVTGEPDCVYLFSGGLDSLCAVIDAATRYRRPLLMSHTPPGHLTHWQRFAADEVIKHHPSGWMFPRVPFDIHRVKDPNPVEVTQRTRPFLFATLGSVFAAQFGLTDVALADNGVVSLNL